MAPFDGGDLPEIDRRLRERADKLVEHLRGETPNKVLSNQRVVRFGRKGGLAVDITGPKKGRIVDFNDGGNKGQSPLQFIQSEISGTVAEAVQWARAWLGIEGERPEPRVRQEDPKPSSAEDEREEAERQATVKRIIGEAGDACRTPAEAYLRSRGITADLPAAVRWRAKAWGRYGSLVLVATDAAGGIKAVQQIYVTADGAKAPIKVQKRSNGSQAGAAVRLPGTAPLTLTEGPETGLSVWQAAGCETWVALGGIGKLVDQVPAGSEVLIPRDADPEGSPADKGLWHAVEALVARGCRVRLACPPRDPVWRRPDQKKIDFNDVLKNEGEEAIRAAIATAEIFEPPVPHYPAAPLPIDQAGALLTSTIENWVAHAVNHVDGEADARQVGAKAAAGTGKSRELLRALQAHPKATECHIDIMVPQHRLADELAWEAAGGPLQVRVIRGREYVQPDGEAMCAKALESRQVASAGFSVWEHMCRRQDPETGEYETCEHFGSCPYVAQFDDPEPAVRIMAHENLFLPRNGGLPKPHAVIIDESFHTKALRRTDFALDRLTAGLWRSSGAKVDMGDQDKRDRIARAARRALEAGKHPRDHGVTAEDCRFVAKLEIGAVESIGITPGMSHAVQRKRLKGYRRNETLKLYRFWKLLEAEIERSGPLRQIELRRDVPGHDGELSDRLYLFWRRDLEIVDVPVLLLDADLDPTIGTKFLPRLEMVDVQVERRAGVIQVMDTPCSRRKLLAWNTAPEDEVKRAANRLTDVQALFNVEAAKGRRVLLVTYKAAADRLTAPAGCAVEWFGNIRGIDRYKDFDTVIVAGREQPPAEAVEAQARALFADDTEPLNLTGELVERKRGYRMRDGRPAEATVWIHPDPRVQALLEQVRERETGQAIDRLRLIHRAAPARVIVLSNVVLDLTVDRVTTWREIMPNALDQMIAAGAVPLDPWADMADAYSDLFPSAEAARKTVGRLTPDKPHIEYLTGKCPELRTTTYRRLRSGKRAVTGRLAYDPRRIDPAAWLAEHLPGAELVAPAAAPVEVVDAPPVFTPVEPMPPLEDAAPRPPPAKPMIEDVNRLQRIVGSASRLADLSAQLDYARPPLPWGDFTDVFREQDWRARLTTLHEEGNAIAEFDEELSCDVAGRLAWTEMIGTSQGAAP